MRISTYLLFIKLCNILNTLNLYLSLILDDSNVAACSEFTIKIKSVSSSIFSKILNFIYTGDIRITVDNIEEILSANQFFKIESLRAACQEAIRKLVSIKSYQKLRAIESKWWFAFYWCNWHRSLKFGNYCRWISIWREKRMSHVCTEKLRKNWRILTIFSRRGKNMILKIYL